MDVARGPSGEGPSTARGASAASSHQSGGNQSQDEDQLENHLRTITLQDLDVKKHKIASGHFGFIDVVQLKKNEWNDRAFVLKRMRKSKLVSLYDQRQILTEKEILSSVSCNFIARYYTTFQDPINLYILMEFCQGGELWSQCPVKPRRAARFYVACMVEALSYLHQKGIVHRDVKAENVVLDSRGYAKLIDFGLAYRLEENTKIYEICGTKLYFAPEIVRLIQLKKTSSSPPTSGGYDETVDLWCLGQLAYSMLDGDSAFGPGNNNEIYEEILGGMEENALWGRVSNDDKAFILELCKEDPTERLGCKERGGFPALRQHSWFRGLNWSLLRDGGFPPPKVPRLTGPADTSQFNESDVSPSNSELENTPPVNDTEWAKDF